MKLGDLPEHGDLFDQPLKRSGVQREARVGLSSLKTSPLVFLTFLDPEGHHLIELGPGQVTERCVFALIRPIAPLGSHLLLEPITQPFAEVGKLVLVREGTERGHDFLPVGQICIVDDIPQILSHDRFEQPHVIGTWRLLGEIRRLCLLHARLPSTDGDDDGVGHALFPKADFHGRLELAEDEGLCDLPIGFRLRAGVDLEGIVGLGALGRRSIGQKIVPISSVVEKGRQSMVVDGGRWCTIDGRRLGRIRTRLLGLLPSGYRGRGRGRGEGMLIVVREAEGFDQLPSRVIGDQRLQNFPVGLLVLGSGMCDPSLTDAGPIILG